jgi:cytochrome c-type biogenesis protein CcmH/NrfF
VLATPSDNGFDLAAWLIPGLAIVVAGGAIVVGLRRWRRAGAASDGGGTAGPEPVPDDEDSKRLDADLARYDL